MANKLVLIGGGGHCKSVLDAALKMDKFSDIVITDSAIPIGTKVLGCEVVGADDCLERLHRNGYEYAFITVGSIKVNPLREWIAAKATALGFEFPVIIDPSAVVSTSASIGNGTFVGKNVTINADASVGQHCIINTGSIIEHECDVQDFVHISVGSILCGEVSVGRNGFIGAGSTVIQCLKIGERTAIGAGAVVNTDIPPNCTAVGIPAKVIKKND